jgi:CRP/FNR family transcriptional regulator, cyclic AMP receptor protein
VRGNGDSGARARSLFVFLRSDALPRLSYRCRPRRFVTGSTVIRQGERADTVHVIVTGRARIEQTTPGIAGRLILGEVGAGDVLCEDAVLAGRRHDVTIRAMTDVRTTCVSRQELLLALLDVPGLPPALRWLTEQRLGTSARPTSAPKKDIEVVAA